MIRKRSDADQYPKLYYKLHCQSKSGGTSIQDFVIAKNSKGGEQELIRQLLNDPNLIDQWKEYFEGYLQK